ncbi:hypothetical protein DMUE_3420 [Dictyocoela muelleri]|nr:hypothetical protein DMUE_3420 [Dictyocoela muelleri]
MLKRINRLKDHEFFNLISSNENIIQLLTILDAIVPNKICKNCKKLMKKIDCNKYNLGKAWKCSKCKNPYSLLDECSLSDIKATPFVFLKFAFYFFSKVHFISKYVIENCGIGEMLYSKLIKFFRNKISNYVKLNKRQLGRVLKEIQIDETFWAKIKKYGSVK